MTDPVAGADTGSSIPIVDLAPFLAGEPEGRRQVVDTIRRACEDTGFFVVVGHGVPDDLIQRMYDTSRAFFDLPTEEKNKVGSTGDVVGGLMFFPIMSESLAASRGEKAPGDLKESLDYGPGFYGVEWPSRPPELESVWDEYYSAMSGLARHIRHVFAAAIGLPEDYFEDKFDRHHSSLRVLNYPEQEASPLAGQLRAGAHTDYGILTILRSEASSGGLQAQGRSGDWIDVPTVPQSFVVNIADAMMRWTNDRWISTLHRVANPPTGSKLGTRRQSIAFFHNPNKDAVIECLEAFASADNPPRYEPVLYDDYAKAKYRQTHGEELK